MSRAVCAAVVLAVAHTGLAHLPAASGVPAYEWSQVAVVPAVLPPMHPGAVVTVEVVLRNEGTETWFGEDASPTPVRLGTAAPRDRVSPFAVQDPTWMWSGGRRIRMETPVVPPGALATFAFTFRAPAEPPYPRSYVEEFAPLVEGGPWMDLHTIALRATVVPANSNLGPIPAPEIPSPSPVPVPSEPPSPPPVPLPQYPPGYSWEFLASIPPVAPPVMHPGEKIVFSVLLQNTGAETWYAEEWNAPHMRLAAVNAPGVQPRERASAFGRDDPTWIFSGGRRVRMTTLEVPPGGIGWFSFTFTAPVLAVYPQTFVERFAPIVEGVALLDQEVISFTTQVVRASSLVPPVPEVGWSPLPSGPVATLEPLPSSPPEIPTPTPSPVPTIPLPNVPALTCPTSASPGVDDVPTAVALGYSQSGTTLSGRVFSPQAIAHGFAKLFVTDTANDRIARTDLAGFAVDYFGSPGSGPGQMRWPGGVAVTDTAIVYVADTGNDRISSWTFAGVPISQFGGTGSEPGQFRSPRGVSVIPNGPMAGNIAVADTGNDRIQIVSRTGAPIAVIGSPGAGPGQLSSPVAVSVWGEQIFVADTGNQRIQRLRLDGSFAGAWGGAESECTALPTGILANGYGVFVAASGSGRIEHFTSWGRLLEVFGTLSSPSSIAMDASGRIYATEAVAGQVARFTAAVSAAPPG